MTLKTRKKEENGQVRALRCSGSDIMTGFQIAMKLQYFMAFLMTSDGWTYWALDVGTAWISHFNP
jgi:hypothetical protein